MALPGSTLHSELCELEVAQCATSALYPSVKGAKTADSEEIAAAMSAHTSGRVVRGEGPLGVAHAGEDNARSPTANAVVTEGIILYVDGGCFAGAGYVFDTDARFITRCGE